MGSGLLPQRLMVDSNVFDLLVVDRDLLAACLRAIVGESLTLVVTHVQADELAAIPDVHSEYRALLIEALEHLAETVVTAGAVVSISRLDLSSFFSEEAAARHELF